MGGMVTVGGSDTGNDPGGGNPDAPRVRGVLLIVVGVAAGLILGTLFTGSGGGEDGPTSTVIDNPADPPTTNPPISTTTTEVQRQRLATMAPGFVDTLVTTAIDRRGMLVVTSWAPPGPVPVPENLPWGQLVADPSRTWLTAATSQRWSGARTLWVGNVAYMEPVTNHLVGEPVWHTRVAGQLAWIEATPEGPTVTTSLFAPGREAVPRPILVVDDTTTLVAWTDAGIVTERSGILALTRETGEIRSSIEIGAILGVGSDLIAVEDPDGGQLLLAPTLDPVGRPPWTGDCWRVEWDGLSAAVVCPDASGGQRWEYWSNVLNLTEPTAVLAGGEYVDVGFSTLGFPMVATIDPLRPSSTIHVYNPADGVLHPVSYPGRIQWFEIVRG
ncbi:MAG TPA: hypothetical protein VLB67_07255 [Acidimicrobiia bacterium]|nr:hypothetical protein [Acidimicrobiia bacterium]